MKAMILQLICTSLHASVGAVNMFDALSIELIKGFSVGIQYFDEYEDADGKFFILCIDLGFVRCLGYWTR